MSVSVNSGDGRLEHTRGLNGPTEKDRRKKQGLLSTPTVRGPNPGDLCPGPTPDTTLPSQPP